MKSQSDIPLKECNVCKKKLPKTDEYFDINRFKYKKKNGDVITYSFLRSKCRECKKAYGKKYYEKNKKKYKKNRKRWGGNNKEKLKNYEVKYRKELNDNYVVKLLENKTNLSRSEIYKRPDLIELKRIQIKTNRLIKQKQS